MHLHILKVILWPRDAQLEPRIIELSSTAVNVLTGQSETGKSALLSIVDYCLGAERCTIPVGLIRNTTEWFGLHLDLGQSELLVARKEPGEFQQTTVAFIREASEISTFPRPETNCSIDDFKQRMNEASGLSGLDTDDNEPGGGFRGRASFRDMAAFNFLPQHIVANPYTLFFKADTYEHQEKLRNVFPLALGAVDNLTLVRRRELRELERDRDLLRKELEARTRALDTWMAELRARYLRAVELGLLRDVPVPHESWDPDRYIQYLRLAIRASHTDPEPQVEVGSTARVLRQMERLNEAEASLSREIGFRRHKIHQLQQLSQGTVDVGSAFYSQGARLTGVGWFVDRLEDKLGACPLCGTAAETHQDHLRALQEVAGNLQRASAAVSNSTSLIDRELVDLQKDLRQLEAELNQVRTERSELDAGDDRVRAQGQRLKEVYRFAGGLENAVSQVDAARGEEGIAARLAEVTGRWEELRRLTDPGAEARRRSAALDVISRGMTVHLKRIGVAGAEAPARLDLTNLTLRVTDDEGRESFLWEIGSAANWVGYHLAVFLALHAHFLTRDGNPVPSFLMIDQPSQAFFPESWPGDPVSGEEEGDQQAQAPALPESDDINRVHQIFEALTSAFAGLNGRLQIVVVDHAGEPTWEGLPIHRVARWRDGEALIPDSWRLAGSG